MTMMGSLCCVEMVLLWMNYKLHPRVKYMALTKTYTSGNFHTEYPNMKVEC